MKEMKLLTIFTPTFNRAYILPKLYESLKHQTDKRFEWLIVDDGSTDNTEKLISEWISAEQSFNIKYCKTANGGKHRAINLGVTLANGEMFFIVDSDDQLTETAVEKIFLWQKTVNDKSNFAGVAGNRGFTQDKLLGTTFEGECVDASALELDKFNISGDKAEVYYTDILKQYPFPEIDGENFLTESVVWHRIAHAGYVLRWVNEIIYLCDYIADGLTMQGREIFAKNPKGYALSVRQTNEFRNCTKKEQAYAAYYYYVDVKKYMSVWQALKLLEMSPLTALFIWWQSLKVFLKPILTRKRT